MEGRPACGRAPAYACGVEICRGGTIIQRWHSVEPKAVAGTLPVAETIRSKRSPLPVARAGASALKKAQSLPRGRLIASISAMESPRLNRRFRPMSVWVASEEPPPKPAPAGTALCSPRRHIGSVRPCRAKCRRIASRARQTRLSAGSPSKTAPLNVNSSCAAGRISRTSYHPLTGRNTVSRSWKPSGRLARICRPRLILQ